MPRDIRELQHDPEAYAAELRQRWGGLLSYRYIGRTWSQMDLGPTDNTVTLRRDMRGPSGAILLAVLGIAAPEGGGMSDLEAVPNPVIHSCQVLDPGRDVSHFEVVSEVLKQGRQLAYSRSRIVDADRPGRVLALTQGQGFSLGTPPAGLEKMPVDPIVIEDGPDLPPLWRVFGAARRPDAHWVLPLLSSEVASPDAALHLGPQFVLLETAAADLVAQAAATDRVEAVSSHVMFLARGKVGPFRADAESVAGVDGVTAVRIVLHDEGDGDRAITAGSYQFRVADSLS
jgi:acyl-coenzyme A thioesterase PaaI-like protein